MPTGSLNEEIWRRSPEYEAAFDEGYNFAKKEILALIKPLKATSTVTSTTINPHQYL